MSRNPTSMSRFKKWALWGGAGTAAVLVTLVAGLFVFQNMSSSAELAEIELPGGHVTVDGTSLYIYCVGKQAADDPVVILENGLGVVSDNWHWIQLDLSARYRVCSYDRAGTGNSSAVEGPVDAGTSADQLNSLLNELQIRAPVLLVGHSYGALMGRVFADRYPDRVAGLISVDSSHQDMGERFPPEAQAGFEQMLSGFGVLEKINMFGGARLMGVAEQLSLGLTGDAHVRAYHHYATTHHAGGAAKEAAGWVTSAQLAREIETFDSIPLTVIMVEGWPDFMMDSWTKMQKELATLSTGSKFVSVPEADHFAIISDQKYSRYVVEEVDAAIMALRRSNQIIGSEAAPGDPAGPL